MRLMVCAGASGGGVYPALAVLQALNNEAEVLWVGGEGGMETDLVARAGFPFKAISAEGVHGVGLRSIRAGFKLVRGYFQARQLIADFKPDALFFTGGYVAIPVAFAGRDIPTVICLPDIEPGRALQLVANFADRIAAPAEDSRQFFPRRKQGQVLVTGYPVRLDLNRWSRAEAHQVFELDPGKLTLFVTGGSKGAQSINRAIVNGLRELLSQVQLIHIAGETTWPEVKAAAAALPASLRANYRPYEYLHDQMGAAYAAADLAVTRAGASSLGELPLFGLPAILVPYPYAWRYQKVNAAYLAEKSAAVVLRDEDLAVELTAGILELIHNKNKRAAMQAAMQALALPNAAHQVAGLIRELVLSPPQPEARG
jgi:UDP-N-acetylglucosamine--N-acetylmuramyl-(pentapeptide) pyrophosphoryl-undecaprenol N-acetylglucosamine transferase